MNHLYNYTILMQVSFRRDFLRPTSTLMLTVLWVPHTLEIVIGNHRCVDKQTPLGENKLGVPSGGPQICRGPTIFGLAIYTSLLVSYNLTLNVYN